jgi:hypothetical protein
MTTIIFIDDEDIDFFESACKHFSISFTNPKELNLIDSIFKLKCYEVTHKEAIDLFYLGKKFNQIKSLQL